MLHHVGLPKTDLDYIYCDGPVMNEALVQGDARMTLFTGSQAVADKLTIDLKGRVKLEDAGFDWKILGPDPTDVDYVVWQSDQDAYAFSGQKCSAQSMLIAHENWLEAGIVEKLKARAAMRKTGVTPQRIEMYQKKMQSAMDVASAHADEVEVLDVTFDDAPLPGTMSGTCATPITVVG